MIWFWIYPTSNLKIPSKIGVVSTFGATKTSKNRSPETVFLDTPSMPRCRSSADFWSKSPERRKASIKKRGWARLGKEKKHHRHSNSDMIHMSICIYVITINYICFRWLKDFFWPLLYLENSILKLTLDFTNWCAASNLAHWKAESNWERYVRDGF